MNFKRFGSLLPDNPLCGIGTYKDELNLATGACTRRIKKLVLDGTENWILSTGWKKTATSVFYAPLNDIIHTSADNVIFIYSNAFVAATRNELYNGDSDMVARTGNEALTIRISDSIATTTADFKSYLAQQYAAGTPVTIWYVLATPTTETITVPSGLSGTEVGYLNQSGTPTPTNPIYPTANTVKKWFDINHYIMGTSTDTLTTLPADIYANDNNATVGLKGNMEQSGTGTTTISSKSVVVQSLETGTNYAKFNIADFPNIAVGDKVTINVGGTNYSLTVKKVDSSYAYIENREV